MYDYEPEEAWKETPGGLPVDHAEPISGVLPGKAKPDRIASDEPLMEAVARGDERAFELIMIRYKNPITNFITRIIRERDRAHDLAQETFIKVYRFAPRYRPGASFSTWIYRIATNLSIEELRRRKRWAVRFTDFKQTETKDQVLANAPERRPNPRAELLRHEVGVKVRRALHSLPAKYRFPVVLRDLQGLSYQEVAKVTRLPLNTVKTRLNRGRLLLREKLRPFVNLPGEIRPMGVEK